ncbi:MAG: tetratricopeptide repeat protein [Nitrospirae bacterium]|nr:tetratricopeptide repeat protein [Nitrospirota bacterium]
MPQNFTAVSELAKRHMLKGRHDKAIEVWNSFLAEAGNHDAANALNNLGDLCLKKKDVVAAIDHYLKASEMFERVGFPLKAIATLKKVLKSEPDRLEVHLRLAELNARRDMIGNAVEAYLTVVRLMTRRGHRDEAMNLLKHICILDPVNIRHRLALAAALFELGYRDEAMAETINAVDLYVEAGNLEEAERYCRHLTGLDPDFQPARERLERIATAGREGIHASGLPVGESSIDDLFAELDGLLPGDPLEPAAAPGTDHAGTPFGAGDDIFSLDGLLEPTGHQAGMEAPDPLLGLGGDLNDALAGLAGAQVDSEPGDLRQEAFRHLEHGDLEAALDMLSRFVNRCLADGNRTEADAALGAYLAADPGNPAAHELRLRIHEGNDPALEQEILERLVSLWSELDPMHADHYRERLERLRGGAEPVFGRESDTPTGSMMIDLGTVALDGGGTERPEWAIAGAAAPDAAAHSPFFSFDLNLADETDGLSLAVDEALRAVTDAHEKHLVTPAGDAPAEALDDTTDAAPDPAGADERPADWLMAGATTAGATPETATWSLDSGTPATDTARTPEVSAWTEDAAPAADAAENAPPSAVDALHQFQRTYAEAVGEQDDLDLRDALAEATFYQHQNLTDAAVQVYQRILARHPGHGQALAQLAELGVAVETSAPAPHAAPEPGAPQPAPRITAPETASEPAPWRAEPVEAAPRAASGPVVTPHVPVGNKAVMRVRDEGGEASDEFLDLAAEIRDVFEDAGTEAWSEVSEQSQLGEILSAFRAGIREQVDDADSETHYDLGVAYREMGLTEEAVGEFQMAIKGVERYADACIALAECFTDMGREHLALGHLRKALGRPDLGPDQWMALAYELATALEHTGETGEAKRLYEQVYAQDIGFRNVAKRLSALG